MDFLCLLYPDFCHYLDQYLHRFGKPFPYHCSLVGNFWFCLHFYRFIRIPHQFHREPRLDRRQFYNWSSSRRSHHIQSFCYCGCHLFLYPEFTAGLSISLSFTQIRGAIGYYEFIPTHPVKDRLLQRRNSTSQNL